MKIFIYCVCLLSANYAWAEPNAFKVELKNYDQYLVQATEHSDEDAAAMLSKFAYECASTNDNSIKHLCANIPYNTEADGLFWLTEAAENGNIDAQLVYARSVPRGVNFSNQSEIWAYRRQAKSYLEDAISAGSSEAMFVNWRWVFDEGGRNSHNATEAYAWVIAAVGCGYEAAVAYKALDEIKNTYEVDLNRSQKSADKIMEAHCASDLDDDK